MCEGNSLQFSREELSYACYLPIVNEVVLFVVISSEEADDEIYQEEGVYDASDDHPC